MKNYIFRKEFKKYRHLNIPVNDFVIGFARKILKPFYKKQRSCKSLDVKKTDIVSRDGYKIKTIIYSSREAREDCPCILFIHGGGFVYPAAPHHYNMARNLTISLKCKTIMIDYRLAPEFKFPYAVYDSFDSYKWILENANMLNINKEKIIVMGDSAGGNLSTVICLMCKENNIQMPLCQLLLYPATDFSMELESMKKYNDVPFITSKDCEIFNDLYMNKNSNEKEEYLYPVKAKNLSNLPPAYIEVAQYDCLHDGGVNYAELLKKSNVHVQLEETEGTMHGYDFIEKSPFVKQCNKKRIKFIKQFI